MRYPLLAEIGLILGAIVLLATLPTTARSGSEYAPRAAMIESWSTQYATYPLYGPVDNLMALRNEPRAAMAWQKLAILVNAQALLESHGGSRELDSEHGQRHPPMLRDWAITLSSTSANTNNAYPAKYSFNVNAPPSCTTDFAVFSVGNPAATSFPNIVGLNNLYSGTAGATGMCNRTPSSSDTGVAATVVWSYAIDPANLEANLSSPELSIDGTRVAFVAAFSSSTSSIANGAEHFHVLAWRSGDGVNSANLQDALGSTLKISSFATNAPQPGSGAVTDLAISNGSSTVSFTTYSPFIDYANDTAYISTSGSSPGIVRVSNVFCTVNPACSNPATAPVPTIDTTWGTSGTALIGGTTCKGNTALTQLTAPIHSARTGNVYVGCGDGNVYGFSSSGVALSPASVAVGDTTGFGGVYAPSILDDVNGLLYVISGSKAANPNKATPVIGQIPVTASGFGTATMTQLSASQNNVASGLRAPALNSAYFTSPTSANWGLYAIGYAVASPPTPGLRFIGFNSSRILSASTTLADTFAQPDFYNSAPVASFLNGAKQYVFLSGRNCASNSTTLCRTISCNMSTSITNCAPGNGTQVTLNGAANSAAAFIVDNVSAAGQASSIYFTPINVSSPNVYAATKLTQAALQ